MNYFANSTYPIFKSLYYDNYNNNFNNSRIIYNKIKNDPNFYIQTDKYLNNIAHRILSIRHNLYNKNTNIDLDIEILTACPSECWNQINIDKLSPFDLLINVDYIYAKTIINKEIKKSILDKIKLSGNKKWIEILSQLNICTENTNIVFDENSNYSHSTLFQAKFTDVAIFSLYLINTYSDLYLPNMKSYLLNNITFDEEAGIPFADNIIIKEPVFPWIINYKSENEYYIHPYLNILINKNKNKKSFACVFISIISDNILHANVLIYDFKNNTIERFEPYGYITGLDIRIDEILEEELTWNTGFKYICPADYLSMASFQMISDENNIDYVKAGDFGGFCLAWCLWYVENRLKNPSILPKTLVKKLINKVASLNIKFIEYIRNYANKINIERVKYLHDIGINEYNTSNLNMNIQDEIKLLSFIIKQSTKYLQ